ncbi:transcription factor IIIB 50 kDa subunit [Brachionichthys hirsutus]|uniref:transcription factor IIIB 50 kDa subunit n=1 Tax=Brachionichthys hirsutus TaxID=412623 RepID=UPI003604631A
MPGAGSSCPACGSSNVIDDDVYSQAQLVCVDCGSVISGGVLAPDPVGGSVVSYSRSTAEAKKPCPNLIKGVQRVTALCQILRVSRDIQELSKTYFKQAYRHESFLKVSLQKKEVLGGCCVLVSSRLRNWPVTMGTISSLLDAGPLVVGVVYQEMLKVLNIEAPVVGVSDVMEAHCQEYKITSQHVPEELAEDYKDLIKRAVALVELAADAWIVTGRRPAPLMMAATYLAWQSLRPNKRRLKVSLDKFCQIAQVRRQKPASTRITEIKAVLCKLGKEIPWVRDTVTPDNAIQQVEVILQNRFALLRRALRTHEDALLAECRDSRAEETVPSHPPDVVEQREPITEAAQAPGAGSDNPHAAPETESEEKREPNWGKRVLFAPPCVTNPKRRRRRAPRDELKDVTGDEEISDSEIDSYIRTPREARDFSLTQKILSSSQSDKS